jgi:transglutaminase-like putative cysteine protease
VVSHRDYWGTRVDSFGVVGKHTRLTIAADAEVATTAAPSPRDGSPWMDARYGAEYHEYLPTPHVTWNDAIADFARGAVAGAVTLSEAATAIQAAVGERLSYEPGTTVVGTRAAEVFDHRSGVCQDYAHLTLASYRSLGLAARYVSGYLYAADSSSGAGPEGDGEIEVSTPPTSSSPANAT